MCLQSSKTSAISFGQLVTDFATSRVLTPSKLCQTTIKVSRNGFIHQLDLWLTQQKGFWQPSLLIIVSEVRGLRRNHHFTNHHDPYCILNICPTGKCSSCPSARKLLFATGGDCYRKPQPIGMQCWGTQPRMGTSTIQFPNLSLGIVGDRWGRGAVEIRAFVGVLWLLGISEALTIRSLQHGCLNMSRIRTTIQIITWMGESHNPLALYKEL